MKTAFKKINVSDRQLSMIQDNVDKKFQQLDLQKILNGNYIEGIDMIAGANSINHGLQGKLTGWIVTRLTNPGSVDVGIVELPSANESILILNANFTCTINLLVF